MCKGASTIDILNTPDKIMSTIRKEIKKALSVLPISLPAKVKSRTANTVDCVSLLDFGIPNSTLSNVPIIQSKYYNYPVKKDDIGLLIPLSYSYSNVLLGLSNFDAVASDNMQNFYFLPLTKTLDEVMNIDDTVITSQDGNNTITISDKDMVFETKGANVSITCDTEGNIKIVAKKEVTIDVTETVTLNAEKEVTINSKEGLTVSTEKPISVTSKDNLEFTIDGDVTITTKGDAKVSADGNATIDVKGDADIKAKGAVNVEATGDAKVKGQNVNVEAQMAATVKNSACKIEVGVAGVDINGGALKVLP